MAMKRETVERYILTAYPAHMFDDIETARKRAASIAENASTVVYISRVVESVGSDEKTPRRKA